MAQGKEKRFDKLLFARHFNRHFCVLPLAFPGVYPPISVGLVLF